MSLTKKRTIFKWTPLPIPILVNLFSVVTAFTAHRPPFPPPPPPTHCKYTQMSIVQCTCTVICNCAEHAFLLFLACMQPASAIPVYGNALSLAESVEWFMEDQAFSQSYDLDPPTPTPSSPVSKLYRRHTERLRKRDNLLTREGEGGGRGSKSYDSETAWSSINNSILSALDAILKLNKQSGGVSVYIYGLFLFLGDGFFPSEEPPNRQAGRQAGWLACSLKWGPGITTPRLGFLPAQIS